MTPDAEASQEPINTGSLPDDLAPDADEPGDEELSAEIADLITEENPLDDEVDDRPDSDIEVEDDE